MTADSQACTPFSPTSMVASEEDPIAAARADGLAAGAIAERARIAAILDHAEAKGREQLARHFAFKTAMAPADATAALAAAPAPHFLSTHEPPKGARHWLH